MAARRKGQARALAYGAFRASRARCYRRLGRAIRHMPAREKIVAPTFDDGPTPDGVDAILGRLRPRGNKATFFLIGSDSAGAKA